MPGIKITEYPQKPQLHHLVTQLEPGRLYRQVNRASYPNLPLSAHLVLGVGEMMRVDGLHECKVYGVSIDGQFAWHAMDTEARFEELLNAELNIFPNKG